MLFCIIMVKLQMITKKSWSCLKILERFVGKIEEQLPQKTVGRQLANCWPTVGQLSADCHLLPFTKIFCQQLVDCRPTVGSMSVICWPIISWEPLLNTRKALARREEHCISTRNETLSLESTILFRFFRDQSPCNLLCLGFVGTKPLTIPSIHPCSEKSMTNL